MGISDNMIRLSIGIEDIDDIIAYFLQAPAWLVIIPGFLIREAGIHRLSMNSSNLNWNYKFLRKRPKIYRYLAFVVVLHL